MFPRQDIERGARSLLREFGAHAEAEALRQAAEADANQMSVTADAWRRIHQIIREFRGSGA
jgi:hypothetical protein